MIAYKFTDTDVKLDDLKDRPIYQAIEQAENTGKTTLLQELYESSFGCHELYKGGYRLQGWYFDIKKYCKRYLIKTKFNDYFMEYYAPNKTTLYNSFYLSRNDIREIIEVAKK